MSGAGKHWVADALLPSEKREPHNILINKTIRLSCSNPYDYFNLKKAELKTKSVSL